MASTRLKRFKQNGRTLCVVLSSFSATEPKLPSKVKAVFDELSPYFPMDYLVVYARDIPDWVIIGKYSGGFVFSRHEIVVSLKGWKSHPAKDLVNTFAHELHHLTRWDDKENEYGYGIKQTLGHAIIADGMACLYAELVSGMKVPWVEKRPSRRVYQEALKYWNDTETDYFEWRVQGPLGKWVIYRLGYFLAKDYFKDGFDLKESTKVQPAKFTSLLKAGAK